MRGRATHTLPRTSEPVTGGGAPGFSQDAEAAELEGRLMGARHVLSIVGPPLIENQPHVDRNSRYVSPKAPPGCLGLSSTACDLGFR